MFFLYRANLIRLLLISMATMCRGYTVRWISCTPSLGWKILTLGSYFMTHLLRVTFAHSFLSFYNKTEYSGLESDIQNSYTNSLLQIMHFTHPIRRLAKSHITTNCPREHCLLCELGFVVRMLEDARGTNCQASNFCKTVGVLATGVSLPITHLLSTPS